MQTLIGVFANPLLACLSAKAVFLLLEQHACCACLEHDNGPISANAIVELLVIHSNIDQDACKAIAALFVVKAVVFAH